MMHTLTVHALIMIKNLMHAAGTFEEEGGLLHHDSQQDSLSTDMDVTPSGSLSSEQSSVSIVRHHLSSFVS